MTYYYFKNSKGPTEVNLSYAMKQLGWGASKERAVFSDLNLMNDAELACFEHKNKLHAWLSQHHLNFSPKTFILDELFFHQTLEKLALLKLDCNWILKPALLNNGAGIKIFSELEDIRTYFRQSDRYSGLYILQEYIEPPLLIDNKKFSLRMFVVISKKKGIYLHPEGYINVCKADYLPTETDKLESHLTNEHLHSDGSTNNQQILTANWPLFDEIWPEIKRQCDAIFTPFLSSNIDPDTYGILGIDFMLDPDKKLWLLEVNHGPCFPTTSEHPLFDSLYQPFWACVVREIV